MNASRTHARTSVMSRTDRLLASSGHAIGLPENMHTYSTRMSGIVSKQEAQLISNAMQRLEVNTMLTTLLDSEQAPVGVWQSLKSIRGSQMSARQLNQA